MSEEVVSKSLADAPDEVVRIIEGVKVQLTTAELRNRLESLRAEHREKADSYAEQLDKLGELEVERNVSLDPTTTLRNRRDEHAKKAAFFAFISDHLVENAVYELSERDLYELELLSRY
jgi:uncharacterized coiled-coil DUF342 family protein